MSENQSHYLDGLLHGVQVAGLAIAVYKSDFNWLSIAAAVLMVLVIVIIYRRKK